MKSFTCPNCGRNYNFGDEAGDDFFFNCMNCRYPVKPREQVKRVRHPELSEPKVIGTIDDRKEVECPYCHSTNTRKIHYFSWIGMVGKQFHCNNCDANF